MRFCCFSNFPAAAFGLFFELLLPVWKKYLISSISDRSGSMLSGVATGVALHWVLLSFCSCKTISLKVELLPKERQMLCDVGLVSLWLWENWWMWKIWTYDFCDSITTLSGYLSKRSTCFTIHSQRDVYVLPYHSQQSWYGNFDMHHESEWVEVLFWCCSSGCVHLIRVC